ncbi:hypothetical protein LB504_002373 [Fusarium proliferatum]|nr:hypothetical protein LB504_002373 [Fusarium proliferatum]
MFRFVEAGTTRQGAVQHQHNSVQFSSVTAAANISSAQSQSQSQSSSWCAGDPAHACILCIRVSEKCVRYDAGTSTIPDYSARPEKVQQISDWMLKLAMGP